jgi:hypothetical protein
VTQTLITTGLYQIGLKRNNLLNNGKHLNDRIISLREVVWAHNTSIAVTVNQLMVATVKHLK